MGKLSLIEWLAAALLIAVLALAGQSYRVARLKHDVTVAQAATETQRALVKSCGEARDREGRQSAASYSGLVDACKAEDQITVQAGRVIERISSAPSKNPDGSQRVISAGELRSVYGSAAPGDGRP